MINDLMLMTGIDIPFQQAQITIHQPTIKEISYIGEEAFWTGCEMLNFSKNLLTIEDKSSLANKSDFEVLLMIMNDKKNPNVRKNRTYMLMLLSIIFPDYKINFIKDGIELKIEEDSYKIDKNNFESLREIIVNMFCLKSRGSESDYNPEGKLAEQIAAKLKEGREKVAKAKGENTNKKISLLDRYMSILSIGNNQGYDSLNNYTVYQLFDAYERFKKKVEFDIYVKAKMAGAQNIEEVDNWMEDIHSDSK